MEQNRLVIIGLDGVPFRMIRQFADSGVMPNTSEIIREGIFRPVRSTIPEISSVAWSSIITGSDSGGHGIFGFIDLHPETYKMRFPNFNDLKAEPFWKSSPGKSIIINVPSTYPVKEMNGVHISGFVSLDFDKSIHPNSLIPALRNMDYQLDVDAQKAHDSIELFCADLDKVLSARIEAYRYLWDKYDWQTFMFVFTGTDRLMHFLWDAYEDENHKYHGFFLEHFKKIDQAIGEICGRLCNGDSIIILSDHGFEGLEKDVYVNKLLADEGFLHFADSSGDSCMLNIGSGTKAFALDPARIYINEKGKYPAGGVDLEDKQQYLKELEELFSSFSIGNRKVIREIRRKEDIYSGPYTKEGPDLVLIADSGFNLKASMAAKKLYDKGPFAGKHTYYDAFLVASEKSLRCELSDDLSVIDLGRFIKNRVNIL